MAKKSVVKSQSSDDLSPGFRLTDIRLLSSSARQPVDELGKKPPSIQQNVQITVGQVKDDKKTLKSIVELSLIDPSSDRGLKIEAAYGLTFKSEKRDFSEEDASKVGTHLAAFLIWPYWREFIQSMATRMVLPPILVPLMDPSKLKMADGKEEKPKPRISQKQRLAKQARQKPKG